MLALISVDLSYELISYFEPIAVKALRFKSGSVFLAQRYQKTILRSAFADAHIHSPFYADICLVKNCKVILYKFPVAPSKQFCLLNFNSNLVALYVRRTGVGRFSSKIQNAHARCHVNGKRWYRRTDAT